MTQNSNVRSPRNSPFLRRIVLYILLAGVFFLLGFFPMWLKFRDSSANLAETTRQLNLVSIQNSLSSAAIDAQRGDFELALQETSSFYTSLRTEVDKQTNTDLTTLQIEGAQKILAGQDETITLLARKDPSSPVHLSDLFETFRQIMK